MLNTFYYESLISFTIENIFILNLALTIAGHVLSHWGIDVVNIIVIHNLL